MQRQRIWLRRTSSDSRSLVIREKDATTEQAVCVLFVGDSVALVWAINKALLTVPADKAISPLEADQTGSA